MSFLLLSCVVVVVVILNKGGVLYFWVLLKYSLPSLGRVSEPGLRNKESADFY